MSVTFGRKMKFFIHPSKTTSKRFKKNLGEEKKEIPYSSIPSKTMPKRFTPFWGK
jgi:hypothetical protein